MLTVGLYASTAEFCRAHASVYGMVAILRGALCGEAVFGFPYPDNREGLAIPLAKAIEGHGGMIWRGRKVAKLNLNTDNGRVGTVVLDDGIEVGAPMVALASGNPRIAELLDPIPPEVEAPLAYSHDNLRHKDFHLFSVLQEPILPADSNHWVGVLSPTGTVCSWLGPIHALAPWAVRQAGTQFVVSACCLPVDEVEDGPHGSEDETFARLADMTDSFYPGFKDAVTIADRHTHKPGHLWFEPLSSGPKLPRTIDAVEGLWFVGEGSTPTCGIWMEAAASAGILGARQMAAAIRNA
jgi:hypothetical protein